MLSTTSRNGSRKLRWRSAVVASLLVVGMAQVIGAPAGAAVSGGRSIEVFTGANLVSLTSYPANTPVLVEVLRQGFVIGDVTKSTDADGAIELNHVGGDDCFTSQFSPDIQPGDVLRTSFGPAGSRTVDTSVVRGVWIDKVRFDTANNKIVVNGHVRLKGPAGVTPKADVLELRINKDSPWDVNSRPGRRDRRVDIGRDVLRNGTWRRVLKSSHADVVEAKAGSEVFLEWSAAAGETEAFPSELTVWDVGEGALPGCPPFMRLPSAPQLAAADDSGIAGDNITRKSTKLNFTGNTGQVGDAATVKLFVNGALRATKAAKAGAYNFALRNLKARAKPYRVMVRAQGDSAPFESAIRRVRIDARKPGVNLRSISPSRTLDLSGAGALNLSYRISEAATMKAKIVNSAGRTVRGYDARKIGAAGTERYRWNGKNKLNRNVSPGRYTMRLEVTDLAGNKIVNREAHMLVTR